MAKITLTNGQGGTKTMALEVWNKISKGGSWRQGNTTWWEAGKEQPQPVLTPKAGSGNRNQNNAGKQVSSQEKPQFIPSEVLEMRAVKELKEKVAILEKENIELKEQNEQLKLVIDEMGKGSVGAKEVATGPGNAPEPSQASVKVEKLPAGDLDPAGNKKAANGKG